MPWMPQKGNAAHREKMRTILILAGLFDMALAGFFLGWGAQVLEIERPVAYLIAAGLAAGAVSIFFIATLAFGRRGTERGLDGDDDEPIVRR